MFNLFKKNKESATEAKQDSSIEKQQEPKKELPNYKKSIQEIENKVSDKKIIDVMKTVKDPELDVDIWTLELIYDLDVQDKNIGIKMTFTSPLCPYGPEIVNQIKKGLNESGYETKIELVFSPPWEPSEQVKDILG